jgi:RNA polymerase sigma factor (sigma-70 family)
MSEPRALLAEYVTTGSEAAFREIVERYIGLVYSAALRLVDGDTHRAEDVVQTVFSDLARLARTLSPELMLGGWLHRRACHGAAALMRSERRRYHREREAMNTPPETTDTAFEQLAPVLDEAINQLGTQDRAAITLRFFEGRDLRSIGAALGSSEDAAQKRVTRALEKLRGLLARRGVTATSAALAAVLSTQVLAGAPAGLAATVSVAALAGAAAASGGGLTLTTLNLISMAKIKIAVGAVLVAGLGTTLVLEQRALGRMREQNRVLEQQVTQLRESAGGQARAGESQAQATDPSPATQEPSRDLSRLRSEVGALRQGKPDLVALKAKNQELRKVTNEPDDPAEVEFNEQTEMRATHLKQWGLSFLLFARDHEGRYPETFEQAAGVQGSESLLGFDTNHFEIVYRGTMESVAKPGNTVIFRERGARRSPRGDWVQVYGFADGHVESHTEPTESGFAAWEQGRVISPPAATSTSKP